MTTNSCCLRWPWPIFVLFVLHLRMSLRAALQKTNERAPLACQCVLFNSVKSNEVCSAVCRGIKQGEPRGESCRANSLCQAGRSSRANGVYTSVVCLERAQAGRTHGYTAVYTSVYTSVLRELSSVRVSGRALGC